MSAGPKWLGLIGPHGSAEADHLATIQRRARAAGLSVRWQRKGDKWSGREGYLFGDIEVVRAGNVVGHVAAVIAWPDSVNERREAKTVWYVRRALDELDRLVAKQEAQGVEVVS